MWYTGIFAIPTLLLSLPRTLNFSLSWMSVLAVISILISCVVAMAGAGKNPTPGRTVQVSVGSNFYTAFISITSPVFAYAVSSFFIVTSCVVADCCSGPLYVLPAGVGNEAVRTCIALTPASFNEICSKPLHRPQDARKAAWALGSFSTLFYILFAVVMYVYIGDKVASPAFSSLPVTWQKAAYGLALPNLLGESSYFLNR